VSIGAMKKTTTTRNWEDTIIHYHYGISNLKTLPDLKKNQSLCDQITVKSMLPLRSN